MLGARNDIAGSVGDDDAAKARGCDVDKYDVVVVGSGALGASAAFHLAKAGRSVALIDQAEIGSQTSPRAAGLTGQLRRAEVMIELAKRSVEKIVGFGEETGEPIVYHQAGSLTVARTATHAAGLAKGVAWGKHNGLSIDLVTPDEAHELQPFLQTDGILAVSCMRTDLYLEPEQVAHGYARAAARLGTVLMPQTRVDAIMAENGKITRIVTDKGEIEASVVVDAAGGWLRGVAEMAGSQAPVAPVRHQLMITVPLPEVNTTQPTVRIMDANVYVRPCRGGLMLGGYERDPMLMDTRDLPRDFRIGDLQHDLTVLLRLAEEVHQQFPIFRGIELQEHRGGLPTMTHDGEHIVGPAPGIEGLYILGGCNVGGLSISPALGEEIANWITRGQPSVDLSRMSPSRFAPGLAEAELRYGAWQRYALYYDPPPPPSAH